MDIDTIRYECLDIDDDKLNFDLPIFNETRVLFGAIKEDGEIVGVLSLIKSYLGGETFFMDYIFVKEDYRDKGVGSNLMEYAEELCDNAGIRLIHTYLSVDVDFFEGFNSFLARNGFSLDEAKSHIITYSLDKITNSKFNKIIEGFKPNDSFVPLYKVSPFWLNDDKNRYLLRYGTYDRSLCRAVVVDNVLTAIIVMGQKDDTLEVPLINILPANNDKNIMPKLISCACKSAIELGLNRLKFTVQGTGLEKGFNSAGVNFEEKIEIREYMMDI